MKSCKALAILGALVLLWSASVRAGDVEEIQAAITRYQQALLQEDADAALKAVDRDSLKYYDRIRSYALEASRAELEALDFMSRLMALRVRLEFRESAIEAMSGGDLLAIGVKSGWGPKSQVASMGEVVNIKVERNLASASLPQAPDSPAFYFTREDGAWKLALWKTFALTGLVMQQVAEQSGLTEDELIVQILEKVTKKQVDDAIFQGPIK